jgi:hypothetical protein
LSSISLHGRLTLVRVQGLTTKSETSSAVERVKRTAAIIADTTKLAKEVAAAVEQQNAATAEIARNVERAPRR